MSPNEPAHDAIPMPVLEQVAGTLRVLAHPHRLKIVELLQVSQLPVGALAEQLDIPAAACSQHLSLMRAHGILSSRREGRTVHYQVEHPSAISMLQCIRNHLL